MFFYTRCSSGYLDFNSHNPVDFFSDRRTFFSLKFRKNEYLYISFKKKSSAPLQCRCGNSAEIFLAFLHKQFAENPETILKLHSFSGIGFLPIGVPLDIWTAIAATILKYFWQTTNFFWLKTQKVVTGYSFLKKSFPQKDSLHTRKALANALLQNFSTNVRNPFTQRPKTTLENHFFFRKKFSSGKNSLHMWIAVTTTLPKIYQQKSKLFALNFQTNKWTHTLFQKNFLRLVLSIRGRHFWQSCAKFLLTKSWKDKLRIWNSILDSFFKNKVFSQLFGAEKQTALATTRLKMFP